MSEVRISTGLLDIINKARRALPQDFHAVSGIMPPHRSSLISNLKSFYHLFLSLKWSLPFRLCVLHDPSIYPHYLISLITSCGDCKWTVCRDWFVPGQCDPYITQAKTNFMSIS